MNFILLKKIKESQRVLIEKNLKTRKRPKPAIIVNIIQIC
jgi:hypothetical protein